jgi:hypothetical protein
MERLSTTRYILCSSCLASRVQSVIIPIPFRCWVLPSFELSSKKDRFWKAHIFVHRVGQHRCSYCLLKHVDLKFVSERCWLPVYFDGFTTVISLRPFWRSKMARPLETCPRRIPRVYRCTGPWLVITKNGSSWILDPCSIPSGKLT